MELTGVEVIDRCETEEGVTDHHEVVEEVRAHNEVVGMVTMVGAEEE
jgi:hypothetical protein